MVIVTTPSEPSTSCLTSIHYVIFFFFNDTATTEIYTLSLHDALPISAADKGKDTRDYLAAAFPELNAWERAGKECRSEERFSRNAETDLVCRLLLEKKKKNK